MDRVLSTRIDDAVYRKIGDLAHRMHASKKAVLEKAITLLSNEYDGNYDRSVFQATCGVWQRDESPAETALRARKAFNQSQQRNRR